MNPARIIDRAPMRFLYRTNPQNLFEVQVKHNKPRARWRHHSFHGTWAATERELWRLIFAEQDRKVAA